MAYILSFDSGTTSVRTVIYGENGETVASAGREITQYYPRPGYVEHDASEIFDRQIETAREAIRKAGISVSDIACAGIANQRETCVLWDRETGEPLCRAIVWQCRRSSELCARLKSGGLEPMIAGRTGLKLDPYFSATKLSWLFEADPALLEKAKSGRVCFGTVDSWLIFRLTGRHLTDVTNASRTLLFNLETLGWDDELLRVFGIPGEILPRVIACDGDFGVIGREFFGAPIPVRGVAGDQQAALFGQRCFDAGSAKNTYGTGCFLLMNTGSIPVSSAHRLLTTVAYRLGDRTAYALEGSVFVGGAVLQWLRDGLKIVDSSPDADIAAVSVPDSGGVYFVPAFTGLGAPYWDADARGLICGITRGTTRAHIIRAAEEAIALQVNDLAEAVRSDGKARGASGLTALAVDGGACRSDFIMQLQANLLGLPVVRPKNIETTSLGAAYLAGIGAGLTDIAELKKRESDEKLFAPSERQADKTAAAELVLGWRKAVSRASSV